MKHQPSRANTFLRIQSKVPRLDLPYPRNSQANMYLVDLIRVRRISLPDSEQFRNYSRPTWETVIILVPRHPTTSICLMKNTGLGIEMGSLMF